MLLSIKRLQNTHIGKLLEEDCIFRSEMMTHHLGKDL